LCDDSVPKRKMATGPYYGFLSGHCSPSPGSNQGQYAIMSADYKIVSFFAACVVNTCACATAHCLDLCHSGILVLLLLT